MKKRCLAVLAGSVVACSAGADTVSFTLDTEFSGAQQPEGHVTMAFTDIAANHVRLTLQGALLNAGREKAKGFYINVDPALVGSTKGASFDMDFALNAGESSGTFNMTGVSKSVNNHKADGDGYFDVLISFATNMDIFNGTDKAVFDITSSSLNFDANSFDFMSAPSGGSGSPGPFPGAAHILGVFDPSKAAGNADGSGWVAPGENPIIPLPQPVLLAGAGLLALAGIRRR